MEISQKEINKLAKAPGRGIYSKEVLPVLKKLKIPHKEISTIVSDYTSFIHKIIITKLKNGTPIFLGVKVYPDESPNWAVDHFILVVGYNELTEELIVNSDNARERVKFSKLLNTENGLSLVHKSRYVYAIEFGVK
jgi:hypothetical protein